MSITIGKIESRIVAAAVLAGKRPVDKLPISEAIKTACKVDEAAIYTPLA